MYTKDKTLCVLEIEEIPKPVYKEIPCLSEAVFNYLKKVNIATVEEISKKLQADPRRVKIKLNQLKWQRFLIKTGNKWKVNEVLK
jgi:predicted transcriptional regulator